MRKVQSIIKHIAAEVEKCNFLLKIGKRFSGRYDKNLSRYLKIKFGFSLEALISTALIFGLIFGSFTFLFLVNVDLLLAFVLAILIFYVIFLLTKNSIISIYKYESVVLASLAPLVFYEFSLNLETSSIFEAIRSISCSEHPIVSQDFRKVLGKISLGQKPEKQLLSYALIQPSNDLKTAILTVLNADKKVIDIGKYFKEAENEQEKISKEIEIKILLIIVVSTFLPLLLTMIYVFWASPWFIFTVPLAQIFFQIFLARSYRMFILEKLETKRDTLSELEECAEFLETYGRFLELCYSPEVALIKTIENISERTREKLRTIIKKVFFHLTPLNKAWSSFIINFNHPYAVISLKVVNRMLEQSSKAAGRKILKIAAKLRERIQVERKRETLIGAQRLKAKIITIASALLLGFIASLIPVIIYSSTFIFGEPWIYPMNNLLITISLLAAVVIMTYTNCKATIDENMRLHVILAVLAYFLAYGVNSFLQHLI